MSKVERGGRNNMNPVEVISFLLIIKQNRKWLGLQKILISKNSILNFMKTLPYTQIAVKNS